MHVNNNQFSDKFNNGWKNIQNGRHFSHFMSIIWPCGHNNDFKFNNGGGLLSSVLLFSHEVTHEYGDHLINGRHLATNFFFFS